MSGGNTAVNGSSNLEIAQSNQDLLISKNKSRRKWIITAVVLTIAVALGIAAVVLLTAQDESSENLPEAAALSLEDFLRGKFAPKTFNGTWTSGHEVLFTDVKGNLVLLDLKTNITQILIDSEDDLLLTAFDFQLSADGLYLLVAYNYQKLYRHSYLAQYVVINLETNTKQELNPITEPYQLVVWSPKGNAFAYVFNNNIFYKNSVTSPDVHQLTSTTDYISNGVPDWVNEEEVFSSNKALWFSPDGQRLAFGRFEDTNVPLMIIPSYGEPGKLSSQYPRANIIKYPKAGATNPKVSLHLINLSDLENINQQELPIPNVINSDPILTAVEWASDTTLTAIWMNRVQNQAALVSYDSTTTPALNTLVKTLTSPNGWLELFTPPIFSKDGSKFVLILSQDQGSDVGSFRHIVMVNNEENGAEQALTKGQFVVTEIIGWDHQENLIYYTANMESNSSVQHIYSISPETRNVNCLTCNLKSKLNSNVECLYNSADFSKDFTHYALTCAGPSVPQVGVYTKGKEVLTWNNNEELNEYVNEKTVPSLKKMSFEVADGFTANVMLRLPPGIDLSGNTKYPMLVNVYGGPDTYQVIDKFILDWGSYLAANKSIIYAVIDGRGSGLRGDKLMFAGYRKLGTVEVEDQINVTKQIQKELPYVDGTRTAIWGWSYGGYVSGMALATDTEGVFKCGISVAPVTDWALYDSIYTERFMGLPTEDDNLLRYENSQLLKKYEGLRDKQYFLIHGTHDDNVHYQQSMMWSKVLELNDILFRQQSYPDEDHNLSSVRPHLYHSLENFLDECFIESET